MKRRGLILTSAAAVIAAASLAACGGGGGGTSPTPAPTMTPSPTPYPTGSPTAPPQITGWQGVLFVTGNPNQSNPQSRTRQSMSRGQYDRAPHRKYAPDTQSLYVPGVVYVIYDRHAVMSDRSMLSRSFAQNVRVTQTLDHSAIGKVTQILSVAPGDEENVIAQAKKQPGVLDAGRSAYRHLESTTALFPNDPFFNGFGPGLPMYENVNSGGQWDMHAIFAANAWGYSQTNTTGHVYPGAAGGGAGAPIAIIDTGAMVSHPELQPSSRIIHAEAETGGSGQVTGSGTGAVNDTDGHGTDVAGIAAASGNNTIGFAGVAYNAPLEIFKVFPSGGNSASSADIATAINDAVSNGAKVINLSLGADTPASDEETAVANAIAAGVVVVAAAGNGNSAGQGQPSLSYPAADPGVLAVGASAIDDSNPANAGLRIASYSNYSTSGMQPGGGAYLVAPGGDACPYSTNPSCNDPNLIHWVENIYNNTGLCAPDPVGGSVTDCRILIIGTSQATPHVTGAVALLLSVGESPSAVAATLCNSTTRLPGSSPFANEQGCGQLNVYHALASYLGDSNYP